MPTPLPALPEITLRSAGPARPIWLSVDTPSMKTPGAPELPPVRPKVPAALVPMKLPITRLLLAPVIRTPIRRLNRARPRTVFPSDRRARASGPVGPVPWIWILSAALLTVALVFTVAPGWV
jgi:hypothetical protein